MLDHPATAALPHKLALSLLHLTLKLVHSLHQQDHLPN
jgi:hypothetical protein